MTASLRTAIRRKPELQRGKQRRANLASRYESEKQRWLAKNPGATAEQIEDAFILIARRVGI